MAPYLIKKLDIGLDTCCTLTGLDIGPVFDTLLNWLNNGLDTGSTSDYNLDNWWYTGLISNGLNICSFLIHPSIGWIVDWTLNPHPMGGKLAQWVDHLFGN